MTTNTYSIPATGALAWRVYGVALIFLIVAAGLVAALAGVEVAIESSIVAGFFGIFAANVVFYFLRKDLFRSHSYAWYVAAFPGHVLNQGQVSCRHCGGRRLSIRNLMNHTFHRAHVCNQCGKTLYYSPEN
jgi:hypothetical protein